MDNTNLLTTHSSCTIAIIGGGFSGAMVAANLLSKATQPLSIKLIEQRDRIGKGVAYSTQSFCHFLNVPAGKMSAFPDDPNHLLRWLQRNTENLKFLIPEQVNANTFIPRKVYGDYLQEILQEAEANASANVKLERIVDEAVAVEPEGNRAIVSLRSGQCFRANRIVLALGNSPATPPAPIAAIGNRTVRQAWSADALKELDPNASVLLIGTGLTMVDTAMALYEQGHRGTVYAVSRRGLFPQRHQLAQPYPVFLNSENTPTTIRALFRRVRQEVEIAAAQGYSWHSVIDALRSVTTQQWQRLPDAEKRRFLRHVKPYWEVHRHRIAPKAVDVIEQMRDTGQLITIRGRIQDCQELPNGVAVALRQRKTQDQIVLRVNRVINCTGADSDYRRSTQPLIAHLRSQQMIRPNALGFGLDTATNGAVLNADGKVSTLLYTLGTPRKGDLWETIAVPEIRGQAQALAETLLRSLRPQLFSFASSHVFKEGTVLDRLVEATKLTQPVLFRQLFDKESSSYTYLIADRKARTAILVDSVLEQAERDLQLLDELELTLHYCLETHIHADHITGADRLREYTGCQVIVPQDAAVTGADGWIADRDVLRLGRVQMLAIATPGHTSSHMAYLVNGTHLLTGDALLIRGCGRTDFQGGNAGRLYDAVVQRLFALPDDTLVYPGHDYKGHTVSTIGEEKRWNLRFAGRDRDQFINLMNNLNLPQPKKMKEAIPTNATCGRTMTQRLANEATQLSNAAA
jgi:uncharacterized NAD(P)/FAD-binding protein YdhS/glyoxylase-like metal-dependent hydrolase (beta-lactamase superfamily II)